MFDYTDLITRYGDTARDAQTERDNLTRALSDSSSAHSLLDASTTARANTDEIISLIDARSAAFTSAQLDLMTEMIRKMKLIIENQDEPTVNP